MTSANSTRDPHTPPPTPPAPPPSSSPSSPSRPMWTQRLCLGAWAARPFVGGVAAGVAAVVFWVAVLPAVAVAQARLVKDIRTAPDPTSNSTGVEAIAATPAFAFYKIREQSIDFLWATDGTATGTRKLFPIGNYTRFTTVGDTLYFATSTALFKTDGSTSTITTVRTGFASAPMYFTAFDGRLYFASGRELWASDGDDASTVIIRTFPAGTSLSFLVDVAGTLFFDATNAGNRELWVSDGTTAGTHYVGQIASLADMAIVGSRLFTINASGLYTSDGTPAGTYRVRASGFGFSDTRSLAPLGTDRVVFVADNGSDGAELWISDGTEIGTTMLVDIRPGNLGSGIDALTSIGPITYFKADDGNGEMVWRTDGTTLGTVIVNATVGPLYTHSPNHLTRWGDTLVFHAQAPSLGREIWVSDGTTTALLKDINPTGNADPGNYLVWNDALLFFATDGVHGREMWISDGTAAGTQMVVDLQPPHADPQDFIELNGRLIFTAISTTGREPWVSDGTFAGTRLLRDIRPGPVSSSRTAFCRFGDHVYFGANDGTATQLWRTDGTPEGTQMVRQFRITAADGGIDKPIVFGDRLVFVADDGIHGTELWITDGTTVGTTMVADIFPGFSSSQVAWITVFDGKLFFSASDTVGNGALWTSDGTAAGTQRFDPTSTAKNPRMLTVVGDKLFFTQNVPGEGIQLFVSDGTVAGTESLTTITQLGDITAMNGIALCRTPTAVWRSDGTVAGTTPIANSSSISHVTVTGNTAYFFKSTDGTVWVTTDPVADPLVQLLPTPSFTAKSTLGVFFAPMGDELLLVASDGVWGRELWKSDGTNAGTVRLTDVADGLRSGAAGDIIAINERIFFVGTGGNHGRELWLYGPEADTVCTGIEHSAVRIADVTGDGVPDLVVTARHATIDGKAEVGAVYVWAGTISANGPPTAVLTVPTAIAGDRLADTAGQGLQLIDVTGDGICDIVVGASRATVDGVANAGAIFVWHGGAAIAGANGGTVAPSAMLAVPTATAGDELGNASGQGIVLRDVTGDGVADVVAATRFATVDGVPRAGAVYVWHGSAALASAWPSPRPPDATLSRPTPFFNDRLGDAAGQALQLIDVTGDGIRDVVVAARWADLDTTASGTPDVPNAGAIFVWRGGGAALTGTPPPMAELTLPNPTANSRLGDTVGRGVIVADVTGDGVPDVIGVASFADVAGVREAGIIAVWAGQATIASAPSAVLTVAGAHHGDRLGVAGTLGIRIADVTGDGTADIVAGAARANLGTATDAGAIYVWAGGATVASHPITLTRMIPGIGDRLGETTGIGIHCHDITGDGIADIVVVAAAADLDTTNDSVRNIMAGGCVIVWNGGPMLGFSAPTEIFDANAQSGDRLGDGGHGGSIRFGDLTGDGIDDLIIPAIHAHAFARYGGAIYVASGGATVGTTSYRLGLGNAQLGDALGRADAAGIRLIDTTGTGQLDLVVPTSGTNLGGPDTGLIAIWHGGTPIGPTPAVLLRAPAASPGDRLGDSPGWAVSMADFDGDGALDLIATARFADAVATDAGAAYVWTNAPNWAHTTYPTVYVTDPLAAPHDRLGDAAGGHGVFLIGAPPNAPLRPILVAARADVGPAVDAGKLLVLPPASAFGSSPFTLAVPTATSGDRLGN